MPAAAVEAAYKAALARANRLTEVVGRPARASIANLDFSAPDEVPPPFPVAPPSADPGLWEIH